MVQILTILGAGVLALVVIQLTMLTFTAARSFAAQETSRKNERELFEQKLAILRLQHKRVAENTLPWSGSRKFQVHRRVEECRDACSFYLKPHDNKPLPVFRPGQYLTFELDIPGRQKRLIRCYSLSDRARPDFYRVTVKRITAPAEKPTLPAGLGSGFFHEQVKEGDIIDVRAPSGGFFLDVARQSPIVLIAGGVGITPLYSMLCEVAESGSKREVWFFYGVRNRHEHIFKEALEKIAAENENIRFHVCYSDPKSGGEKGKDYHHAGRVTIDLLKQLLPSNNFDFYICGPGPMMESMTKGLAEWGVPEDSVHFEAFGPASVKKSAHAAAVSSTVPDTEVTFEKSGRKVIWKNSEDSLLDLALAAEIPIEYGCRAGDCGTCKVAIKSGAVRYQKTPGYKSEAGTCLTCCCVPDGHVVLDA